jgi:hypothetical protein
MRLTSESRKIVKTNRRCINLLAVEMDVHSATIERHIDTNENNGILTTEAATKIITKETGIPKSKLLTKN